MTTTCVLVLLSVVAADSAPSPSGPYESQVEGVPAGRIDEIVFGRLTELKIQPARLCSDEVFVRRVYLDVLGTLPTAQEAREFLRDSNPRKRAILIDRLLEREEFADYWGMKWSDLLRVKAEFPINLWPNAAQAYHRWIRKSIQENLPYDQFAREMLTANGSNFRVGQVNFYRAVQNKTPEGIAQAVALTFLGERADRWPPERLAGMAAFFGQIGYKSTGEWKEEIVSFDADKQSVNAAGQPLPKPQFPDGTAPALAPDRDPRQVFADWLVAPENPWFARNLANRIWFWLLGRGIVHEPDDMRADNPPSHPELLDYLAHELVAAKFNSKHLFRLILNSNVYQLSPVPRSEHPQAAVNFASYPLRRLDAEVLIDALNQITGTTEQYSSPIPEPFTYIPEGQRSIALPDGSITSPFLEQFGRPARDTGLEAERSNRPTAGQRLHLLNSTHIQRKIENSPLLQGILGAASGAGKSASKGGFVGQRFSGGKAGNKAAGKLGESKDDRGREAVETLYLTILSRYPTESERRTVADYVQATTSKREALIDLTWALINSSEFLYRH